MKKAIIYLIGLIILMLAVPTVSAGNVVFPWSGSNTCQNPSDPMITFEDGTDLLTITNQYPSVLFSVPTGGIWIYGDVSTGHWNYPVFWTNGNFWAIIDPYNEPFSNTGRIDFTVPTSYVSVLVTSSGDPGVKMEAYNSGNTLIDQTNDCPDTLGTNTMCQLTVSGTDIKYVLIHDDNDEWVIDDLCYGSTGGISTPEFPSVFLPAAMIIGFLGAVLLIQRTRVK